MVGGEAEDALEGGRVDDLAGRAAEGRLVDLEGGVRGRSAEGRPGEELHHSGLDAVSAGEGAEKEGECRKKRYKERVGEGRGIADGQKEGVEDEEDEVKEEGTEYDDYGKKGEE